MKVKTVKLCPCFYGGWHQSSGYFPAPIHGHLANGPSAQHCGGWIFSNLSPRLGQSSCVENERAEREVLDPKTVERWKMMKDNVPPALLHSPLCLSVHKVLRHWGSTTPSRWSRTQHEDCAAGPHTITVSGVFLILLGTTVATCSYNFSTR